MEVSKIRNVFDLEWLMLATDAAKMFALVPRGEKNNANAHGYICEMESGYWKCAGIDTDGEMKELGLQPRRIDARQAVQKQVIRTFRELIPVDEEIEI